MAGSAAVGDLQRPTRISHPRSCQFCHSDDDPSYALPNCKACNHHVNLSDGLLPFCEIVKRIFALLAMPNLRILVKRKRYCKDDHCTTQSRRAAGRTHSNSKPPSYLTLRCAAV